MRRIIHSARSRLDLLDIWLYIAQDNVDAADRLADEFENAFVKISEFPGIGRSRDEISASLRSYPVGDYLIFYRVTSETIGIARIVHGARDLRRVFRRRRR